MFVYGTQYLRDSRLVFLGERRPDLYGILADETVGYNG